MNKMDNNIRDKWNHKRDSFDLSRKIDKTSACNAPYTNMYMTVEGHISPCWLTVGHLESWTENSNLKDIWNGEKFRQYRTNLKNGCFEGQCRICKQKIEADVWPLALAYDGNSIKEYPTMLELELSNQCNLECIMCNGRLSSGIRKNREKLPPLKMVYDDRFVEQLKDFIPHLEELRFNGGEPFAQKIVHDICFLVQEINPSLKINFATNGSVYNNKVKEILEKCNVHLNISIDSLIKENYERIRVNGDFKKLMDNFLIFKDYCHANNRNLSVMVNPMRNNWFEMHNFVEFCNEHRVHLWYNTIHHPVHLALWNLSSDKLQLIMNTLKIHVEALKPINDQNPVAFGNWEKYNHLVNGQIANWYRKQLVREV